MAETRSHSRIGYVSSVYSSWLSESSMRLYNLKARVCANWQWNARDCVTGLHSWLRRSCNPVTQSRAFHFHFAHTRAFSIWSQKHIVYKRNWDGACLINFSQKSVYIPDILKYILI